MDRYVRSVDRAGLGLVNRARLALLLESVEDGPAEGTGRIRYLTELARETAADGKAELAMDLLIGAAAAAGGRTPAGTSGCLLPGDSPAAGTRPAASAAAARAGLRRPDLRRRGPGRISGSLRGGSDDPAQRLISVSPRRFSACSARPADSSRMPFRDGAWQGGSACCPGANDDAISAVYTCQWHDAIAAAAECEGVAVEAGQYRWIAMSRVSRALATAMRGEDDTAERLACEAEQILMPAGIGSALALVQLARGLAALGRRDYQQAYSHLIRVYDPSSTSFHHLLRLYHLGDLADAAVHSGHEEQARSLVTELAAAAAPEPGPARRRQPRLRGGDARRRPGRPRHVRAGAGRERAELAAAPCPAEAGIRRLAAPGTARRHDRDRICVPHARCWTRSARGPGATGPTPSCAPPANTAAPRRRLRPARPAHGPGTADRPHGPGGPVQPRDR